MSLRDQPARAFMSTTVHEVAPDASLLEAAQRMWERGVDCLLVPAREPGRAPGIITGKDLVVLLCEAEAEVLEALQVSEVATSPALGVPEDLLLPDCLRLMRMTGFRRVFVQRGTEVVGVISFTDVLKALVQGTSDPSSMPGETT